MKDDYWLLNPSARAKAQTTDEWLKEYDTGVPVFPGSLATPKVTLENSASIYRYIGHRTADVQGRASGTLILEFENIATGLLAVTFFNVDVCYQRGDRQGKVRRIGNKGQFLPAPGSKFRKFWMEAVGEEPIRWSTVHKEFRARLSDLLFTGDVEPKRDAKGQPYYEIKALIKI